MKKRVRNAFTEKEKNEIIELYRQGKTITEIMRIIESLAGRKPQTLYPILIKEGLYIKKPANDLRRYKVNDNYFSIIDNEHKAYWLGFLCADGFVTISKKTGKEIGLSLARKDRYMLELLQKDLETTYKIHDYTQVTTFGVSNYSRLLIRSNQIYDDLAAIGFGPDKTNTIKFPYEKVPEHLWRHFIRGYFDGNGSLCVSGDKKYHTFDIGFTGTLEMMSAIKTILGKENLKLSQRFPGRNKNNYDIKICGDKQVSEIMFFLYRGATIALERKFLRYWSLVSKKYAS